MIRYEVRDAVAVVTLDRPERLNALTVEMREALGTHFETAGRDMGVRAVLLQAMQSADHKEGVRAFLEKRAPTFKGS